MQQRHVCNGMAYVVSGPAFIWSDIQSVGNVLVPTHIWKVLYRPKQQRADVYLATNNDTREYSAVTLSDLDLKVKTPRLISKFN